jgi:hypothetical protein
MLNGSLNIVTYLLLALTGAGVAGCWWWTGKLLWTAIVLVVGLYVSASPRMVME